MSRDALTYTLTPALVAAHAGGPVVCLAVEAEGQRYRLHAGAPDAVPATLRYLPDRDLVRGEVVGAGGVTDLSTAETAPLLARVHISGPLESVCGYQGECGGWSDGYGGEGGVVSRMRDALADADVLLTIDSPGGSVIGLPECVATICAERDRLGRKVYVVVTGWAASAAYWIASSVASTGELYVSISAMAGNIGARAAHGNQAGALAQEGIEITDFAYPPGKIALSPNRAPTATGILRGERDVMLAFEAFASAVGSARPKLMRDAIVKLDGDLLTGAGAVAKDLADAVGTVEAVERWALGQAGAEDMTMHVRGEGAPEPPEKDDPPPSKPGGRAEAEGKAECAKCGEPMPSGARYCAKCGEPATKADDAPGSDRKPMPAPPPAAHANGAASQIATLSHPALKSHAANLEAQIADVAAALGGSRTRTALGARVEAVVADAAQMPRYRRERDEQRAENAKRERLDILKALADGGIHPRGEVLVDIIDDKTGKAIGVRPAALWSDGAEGRTLVNLRSYAAAKLGAERPTREASPYGTPPAEPNETAAAMRVNGSQVTAQKSPAVRQAAKAGVAEDEAAAILAREFGRSAG